MSCDLLIEVESIDELTIDATCDEEITVSIADVEEVAVEAFDYPPEIEQLNQELAAQMEAINLNAGAIASLQGDVASLDERVGGLEDDVIYEDITEEDVASLTISIDKNGMPLNLRRMRLFVSGDFTQPSAYQVRINNRTDDIYRNYVLDPLANQAYRNRFYIESTTSFITEKMLVDITIENNEAFVDHRVNAIRPDNAALASNRGLSYTHGLESDVITSVTIFSYSTLSLIKAGTKITIRK